jgi:hypothetical protein
MSPPSFSQARSPALLDENPPSAAGRPESSHGTSLRWSSCMVRRHCPPASAPPAGSFQEVSSRLENTPRKLPGNFRRPQTSLSLQGRNFVEAQKVSPPASFFADSSLSSPSASPFVKVTCPTRSTDLGISDPHIYGVLRSRAGSGCRCYISANFDFESSVTF